MAATTRKRPKSLSVSKSAVDQAGSFLQELPEKAKENWSLREAVDQLQVQIKAALAKGYNYDEVADLLEGKGIEISASTLKRYVSIGSSRSKAVGAQRTRRPRKDQFEESAASSQETVAAKATRGRRKSVMTVVEPEQETRATPKSTGRGRSKTTVEEPSTTKTSTRSTSTRGRKKAGV